MRHSSRRLLLLALVLIGAPAVGALAEKPGWVARDTLVVGRESDSRSLDPVAVDDGESVKVIDNIYETLVSIGPGGRPTPLLATHWAVMDGAHGYTFTIRQNVRFHDGKPMTAAAVAASLKRLIDSDTAPYRAFYRTIKKVMAFDDKVQVWTHVPDGTLLYNLAMFPAAIVSPSAVARYGRQYGRKQAVGTGPFRFRRWDRDKSLVLERNADYWGKKAGVSKLEFRVVAGQDRRLRALAKGQLSLVGAAPPGAVPKGVSRVTSKPGQQISLCYLGMNTQVAPFDNPKFRRAIAHALDKKAIAKLYKGLATPLGQPIPPGVNGHSSGVKGLSFDLKRARKLLLESGVKGRTFTLAHMTNARPYILTPAAVARLIKAQLARIGLVIELAPMGWRRYLGHVQGGNQQLFLLGWTTDNGDADNFLWTFFHSENATRGAALNISFFKSPRMDRLLVLQRREVDPGRRATRIAEAARFAVEQAPIVPLIAARTYVLHHPRLMGVSIGPLHSRNLWQITIRK